MKPQTYEVLKRLLALDGGIDKRRVDYALDVLAGRVGVPEKPARQGVMKRAEVSRLLSVSLRTVDLYVTQGLLTRVYGGGGKQAIGISRQSYESFLSQGSRRA